MFLILISKTPWNSTVARWFLDRYHNRGAVPLSASLRHQGHGMLALAAVLKGINIPGFAIYNYAVQIPLYARKFG